MVLRPWDEHIVRFRHDDGGGGGGHVGASEAVAVDSGVRLWDGVTGPELDRVNVLLCRDGDDARHRMRQWDADSLEGVAIIVALPVADGRSIDPRLARELDGVALMLVPADTTPANALERIEQLIGAPDAPGGGARAADGDMDPAYGEDDLGVGPRDRDAWLEAMRSSGADD